MGYCELCGYVKEEDQKILNFFRPATIPSEEDLCNIKKSLSSEIN